MTELKKFAVIGSPIDHSLSPKIHSIFAKELGIDKPPVGGGRGSIVRTGLASQGIATSNGIIPLKDTGSSTPEVNNARGGNLCTIKINEKVRYLYCIVYACICFYFILHELRRHRDWCFF